MRNKNLKFQLIYRGITLCICLLASIFSFVDNREHIVRAFLYYTNWSVWFVTIVTLIVFIGTLKKVLKGEKEGDNTLIPILKFASNITIIATFIVGGIVLGQFFDTFGHALRHFFVPVLSVLDVVLFDARNRYRVSYPFLAVIPSLIYWAVIIIRNIAAGGGSSNPIPEAKWADYYPYGFTNFDNGHSVGGLIGMLAGILCGLILIGFIFWLVDKLHKENGKVVFDKKAVTNDIFSSRK